MVDSSLPAGQGTWGVTSLPPEPPPPLMVPPEPPPPLVVLPAVPPDPSVVPLVVSPEPPEQPSKAAEIHSRGTETTGRNEPKGKRCFIGAEYLIGAWGTRLGRGGCIRRPEDRVFADNEVLGVLFDEFG